ncbi:MAG: polymer-forming cytoskeletal protein [Leptospiraceae bacterium]|nr:polymer-forming cytoskeletal protein [Leptospiraceae bacterium]MDW7976959.1 polymer-forming cytoskeletal protein [Leptospiraceae bacterium]
MDEITQAVAVNSIIGEGSEFRGEFKVKNLLRIDGYFKGTIFTDEGKILIGRTGKVETDIKAAVVVVGGEVIGNILATKRVVLLSSSRVKGDIVTPALIVEEGCVFEGRCTINKEPIKLT